MSPLPRWLGLPQAARPGRARRSSPDDGAVSLTRGQLRTAWQAVSLLVGYPGDELRAQLPALRSAIAELPAEVGVPLGRLVEHLEKSGSAAEIDYIDTFDWTRKCSLFLTYYAFGDTRKRGVALVRFKQAYRRCGMEIGDDELPDHLSVVCEFGAFGDLDVAWRLLVEHRAGLEMLRLALTDRESPWVDAIDALCATLPPLDGEGREAVARLLADGPPGEDVGLDAYALDPSLNDHEAVFSDGSEFLGMPQTTGVRS
ncbi:nitrate reductase molybdenum cofactor assembly chaperone [Nigerium sp.]|uniref:nitrate reductase molybdenum cofactor assembly chaperone n=1 Tax=Nigerium sp. TaxID=2042655 RepID=UPI003221D54D